MFGTYCAVCALHKHRNAGSLLCVDFGRLSHEGPRTCGSLPTFHSATTISPPIFFFKLPKVVSKSILESRFNLRLKIYLPLLRSLHRTSAPQLPRRVPWRGTVKYSPTTNQPTNSLTSDDGLLSHRSSTTYDVNACPGQPPHASLDLPANPNPPPPPTQCRGKSQRVRVHPDLPLLRRLQFADLVASACLCAGLKPQENGDAPTALGSGFCRLVQRSVYTVLIYCVYRTERDPFGAPRKYLLPYTLYSLN